MKVFVAKVFGWEEHEILGVFSSEEAAQSRIDHLFANLQHPDEVDLIGKVESFELDEITPSHYEIEDY